MSFSSSPCHSSDELESGFGWIRMCVCEEDTGQERSSSGCSMIHGPFPLQNCARNVLADHCGVVTGWVRGKHKLWRGHFLSSCSCPVLDLRYTHMLLFKIAFFMLY